MRFAVVILALWSPSIAAQPVVATTAVERVECVAQRGGQLRRERVPIGSDLLTRDCSALIPGQTAAISTRLFQTPESVSVRLELRAASAWTGGPAPARASAHSALRLVIRSSAPTRARIEIDAGLGSRYGAAAATAVDLDADGRIELDGAGRYAVSRTLDAGGITVRIVQRAESYVLSTFDPDAVASNIVRVRVLPEVSAAFESFGSGCGPTLVGTSNFGATPTVSVQSPYGEFPCWIAVGTEATDLSLNGCRLLVQPLIGVPLLLDPAGRASLELSVSPASAARLQAVTIDPVLGLRTTNGLTVSGR